MNAYERMKTLLGEGEYDVLTLLLEDAKQDILNFCNRDDLPDALINTQVKIAVKYYNRRGREGDASYSEGAVSESFDTVFTDDIKRTLYRYKKAVPSQFRKKE
jgi:hypothetical protein